MTNDKWQMTKQKEYTQWPENNSQPRAKPAQLCIKDPPKKEEKSAIWLMS